MFSKRTLILSLTALILVFLTVYLMITKTEAKNLVLVAMTNIEKGSVIEEENVTVKAIMADYIMENALSNKKDVVGMIANIERLKGDQITKDVIGEEQSSVKEISRKGNVIYYLDISKKEGISKIIKKGDYISIIRTKYPSQTSENPTLPKSVVVNSVRVIDIIEEDEKRGSTVLKGESSVITILIEVDRDTAKELAMLEELKGFKIVFEKGEI